MSLMKKYFYLKLELTDKCPKLDRVFKLRENYRNMSEFSEKKFACNHFVQ